MKQKKTYIIFDGSCGFCNRAAIFVAKRDLKAHFLLVSSRSSLGQALLTKHLLNGLEAHTVILITKEKKLFTETNAVIKILKNLPYLKPLAYLLWLIPKFIRDYFYKIFSRNRYLFVSKNNCEIPKKALLNRFVLK